MLKSCYIKAVLFLLFFSLTINCGIAEESQDPQALPAEDVEVAIAHLRYEDFKTLSNEEQIATFAELSSPEIYYLVKSSDSENWPVTAYDLVTEENAKEFIILNEYNGSLSFNLNWPIYGGYDPDTIASIEDLSGTVTVSRDGGDGGYTMCYGRNEDGTLPNNSQRSVPKTSATVRTGLLNILFVVLYHLLAPCLAKTVVIHLAESMMIAFFIFSGYFYRPGRRTLGENIKTRLKATMLPFVKYSTVFWIIGSIYLLVTHQETMLDALCCLRNFYAGCIWNRVIQGWFNWDYHSLGSRYMFLADFWFLIALFLSSLLFFPIADATLSSRKKAIGAAALLFATTGILRAFAVSLPYNIQLVPFWTAFMLLGALAGKEGLFDLCLVGIFDTIAVRVHFGASGCKRMPFVLVLTSLLTYMKSPPQKSIRPLSPQPSAFAQR